MTPTLFDLALKAGFSEPIEGWMGEAYEERLYAFAALVAAAEREACAKLCLETEPFYGVMFAEAIRARGQE